MPATSQISAQISAEDSSACSRVRTLFWLAAFGLGGAAFWIDRNSTNTDGISYIDVASAFGRHDWAGAINAYWSPLYPFVLGIALKIVRPAAFREFTVVHLVNFVIFLCAAAALEFFISRLLRYQRRLALAAESARASIPEPALRALGYSLFLWSSLRLITISDISPDMLVAVFLYLAAGIVLSVRPMSALDFALLGIVLGFGYLAKAPVLPVGIVFLAAAVFASGDFGKAVVRVPVGVIALVLVAGPFIAALSHYQGRLTWGDSAKLNYAWYVNHVPRYHWQGELRGLGKPVHESEKLSDIPVVYAFDEPKISTYSIWFDPSYWNQGVHLVFDGESILVQMRANLAAYDDVILGQQAYVLIAALVLLIGFRGRLALQDVARYWMLLLPVAAALGMFALVHVEVRMIGAYVVILWMALFAAVQFENTYGPLKLAGRGAVCVSLFAIFTLGLGMLGDLFSHGRADLMAWSNPDALPQWQVVNELNRMGIHAGDKVAWFRPGALDDRTQNYSWARLARVRIVAEIPTGGADDFWSAAPERQSAVLGDFARAGAVAVVATRMPPRVSSDSWLPLKKSGYFVHLLNNSSSPY